MLYPEWSAALREETGIDNGYRRTGGVDVAFTADEERDLRSMAGRWRAEGVVFERLAPGDFAAGRARAQPRPPRRLFPARPRPDPQPLAPPRPGRRRDDAGRDAPAGRGGRRVRDGRRAGLGRRDGRRARSPAARSSSPRGPGPAACSTASGVHAPTPPLKGQIVLLRGDRPLLRRIVEHGKNYLVPREDGRVLVGATEEDAGFDTRPTPAGVRDLIDEALRLCPVAGRRRGRDEPGPGSGPGASTPGLTSAPVPGFANAFVAAGHKRAGLQLSPATAEVVTDLVLGRPPRIDLSPFRVGREPAPAEDEAFRS